LQGLEAEVFCRDTSPEAQGIVHRFLKDLPDFRTSPSSFSRTSFSKVIVVLVGTP